LLIRDSFESVVPTRRVNKILNNPDDNHILATASEADASFIISGDRHLLELMEREGICMISSAVFMEEIIEI
jgi:predicted nucleic acid-binding protein